MNSDTILFILVLFLLFIGLFLFFVARIRAGHRPQLRHIEAFAALKGFNSQAVEAGRPLHLSLGIGSMVNETTADSLAGLLILDYLADQARLTGVHPLVSMANPTVMLFAQNGMQKAHGDDSQSVTAAYQHIRWIAPQPAAYAAGVMSLLDIEKVDTNIMVGNFGDEYLLMGEAAARRQASHIGGTSDPNTLPFIYASAQETLLGEEIYAAGAYLQKLPSHLASLLTQDTVRWLVAVTILGGVIMASLR